MQAPYARPRGCRILGKPLGRAHDSPYAVHKKQPLMHIMQALLHIMHKTAPYGVHKTALGAMQDPYAVHKPTPGAVEC